MGISLVDAEVPGDLGAVEKALREAVAERESGTPPAGSPPASPPQAEATTDGDDVPVKLRGKSRAEIIEHYRNLESAFGRQANDLGTQRKLTDRILDLKRESDLTSNGAPASRPAAPKVTTQELLDNPDEVIERTVSARLQEREQKFRQEQEQAAQAAAAQNFINNHADYETLQNDPELIAWLEASPVRRRAALQARGGDFTVADELLTEFKQVRASKAKTTSETVVNSNQQAAKSASLESGTASEHASKKTSGKIYRRVDLMNLKLHNKELYYDDAFQQEILLAYAEGRVK